MTNSINAHIGRLADGPLFTPNQVRRASLFERLQERADLLGVKVQFTDAMDPLEYLMALGEMIDAQLEALDGPQPFVGNIWDEDDYP